MRIGELSTRTGITTKTIRYYEHVGLLPDPPRTAAGYRDYDDSAIGRLSFVRAAQSIGLTLGEIREVIAVRERGESPCPHVAELIRLHAEDLTKRIAALQDMRRELVRLAKVTARAEPLGRDPASVCHVIEGRQKQE